MQTKFLDSLPKHRLEVLLREQIEILHMCAANDVPLVVLEYRGYGDTLEELDSEILNVKRVIRIMKSQNSGFSCCELHNHLRKLKARKLLFLGVNASFCVQDTASSALGLGYTVLTASTLTTNSEDVDLHGWGLHRTFQWFEENGHVFEKTPVLEDIAGV